MFIQTINCGNTLQTIPLNGNLCGYGLTNFNMNDSTNVAQSLTGHTFRL